MPSEYDALLESTPAQQKSEYDQLLSQQPKSSVLGEIGTAIKNTAVGFVKGLARPPSLAEIALPIFGGQIERQYEHAKSAEQAIRSGQPAASSIAQAYAPNVSELASSEATRAEKIQAGVNIAAEVAPFLVPALRGIGKYGVAGRSLSDIAFGAKPEPLQAETAAAEQIQKGGEISAQKSYSETGAVSTEQGKPAISETAVQAQKGDTRQTPAQTPNAPQVAPAVPQPEQAASQPSIYYHGTRGELQGSPKIAQTAEEISTGMFGKIKVVGSVFKGFFGAKEKGYAGLYSAGDESKIIPFTLSSDAKVLKLPNIISEEVLTSRGWGRAKELTSLPQPTEPFPFQKDFENYAFERLNKERAIRGAEPFTRAQFDKRTNGEWNPSHNNYDIEEIASKYLPDYIKSKGYDAVEMGREIAVLNPDKVITHQPTPVSEGGAGIQPSISKEIKGKTPATGAATVTTGTGDFVRLDVKHKQTALGTLAPYQLPEGQYRLKIGEQKKSGIQFIPVDDVGNPIQLTDVSGRPIDSINLHKKTVETLPPEFTREPVHVPKTEGVSQPTETTPAAAIKSGDSVRISGETYKFVKFNDDGTIRVRSEGGEFDTAPNEKWEPIGKESSGLRAGVVDTTKISRENFISNEIYRIQRVRQIALTEAEHAIRTQFTPAKKLPVGISKIQAFLVKDRYTPAERKLRTQYDLAKKNLEADTRSDAETAGKVWDAFKAKQGGIGQATENAGREYSLPSGEVSRYGIRDRNVAQPQTPVVTEPTTAQPLTQTTKGGVSEEVQKAQDEGQGRQGVLVPEAATVQPPAAPPETPEELGQALKEPGRTAGVANRVLQERAAKGEIPQAPAAGEGHLTEDIINKSRAEYSPERALVAAQNVRNGSLSEADAGQVRIHEEALTKIAANAERALDADPKNPALKQAYETAKAALTQWHNDTVQPMKTTWSNAGKSMQGETDIDTGSYIGLQKLAWDTAKRDFTAKEEPVMKLAAKRVSKLTDDVRSAISKAEDQVQKVLKPSKYMDLNQLRESLAETLKSITC